MNDMKEIISMIDYCSLDELDQISKAVQKARRKFPKQPKKDTCQPSDPVIDFRLRCHRLCKSWLCEHGHECHAWDGLQNKGLNGIIDKIKYALSKHEGVLTEERILQSFEGMMNSLPEFYANKVDFDLFDRRFNAIVSEIKANKNGRQQITGKNGFNTDVANEALQLLNARVSNRQ